MKGFDALFLYDLPYSTMSLVCCTVFCYYCRGMPNAYRSQVQLDQPFFLSDTSHCHLPQNKRENCEAEIFTRVKRSLNNVGKKEKERKAITCF